MRLWVYMYLWSSILCKCHSICGVIGLIFWKYKFENNFLQISMLILFGICSFISIFLKWFLFKVVFSSPEPKARVSYCHSAPSVRRKLSTFSTSSPEPLDGFWWNLEGMKYSWSLTSVVVFRPDPPRGGAKICHWGLLLQRTSSSDRKATAKNQMHSSDLEACGKKCCYFWFHSKVKFLTRFWRLFGLSHICEF